MGLGTGIAIGAGLGILLDNLALGTAMDTGVGVLSEPVSPRATRTRKT